VHCPACRKENGDGVRLPAPCRALAEIEIAGIGQGARGGARGTTDYRARDGAADKGAGSRAGSGTYQSTGQSAFTGSGTACGKRERRDRGEKHVTSHFFIFLWLVVHCVRFNSWPVAVPEVSDEQIPNEPSRVSVPHHAYGYPIAADRIGMYS
jgi:hypothetical protein